MKARRAGPRLHALEVPLEGMSLLIPSASVAEVVNLSTLTAVPFSEPWLLGVIGWRTLAVPVVSFEALLGAPTPGGRAGGKILIFYPMSGRKDWEFYGVLATAEPRPQALDGSQPPVPEAGLPNSSYIASGLKIDNRSMFIPDLVALQKAFYP
ncbi:MAG TPA: chemotaxis protein CheW [Candidatus Methylomirabilis sp.]|nr:chemotaxis protein CheW [Candidatus Methylomirabilis sp.]